MAEILDKVTQVFTMVVNMMQSVLNTILAEPLIFLPLIFALFGGAVIFALKKLKALGVRAGSGRRRRRR